MSRRGHRGSAYVSPVISSCSSSEEEGPNAQRRSQLVRRRRYSSSSSSSSSDESSEDDILIVDGEDPDVVDEFVDRKRSNRASVAKLDRLRRIFLNQPSKPKRTSRKADDEIHSTTTSNSSVENVVVSKPSSEDGVLSITLAIGHHVAALRDQVHRLARHHDAHAQQWQAMLTQAIDELTFVKQQEERALQSHVRLVHESYALRLEVFEQQYRAKVAEIRDAMRVEIAHQQQQSEAALVAAAKRLQQQTQQLFQSDDTPSLPDVPLTTPDRLGMLAKTTAFLDRQRIREDARRRRVAEVSPIETKEAGVSAVAFSPVSRQRAKLRMLEQKLASFSSETVDRVVRTVEQERERRGRPDQALTNKEVPTTDPLLRPTPLSPLRRRDSYWRNGISREEHNDRPLLNRRFLRHEEEQELRALRNSIGLAKDWMETHALR